jgi:RNA polymerase sigma-70 factor (ECF subfamily)
MEGPEAGDGDLLDRFHLGDATAFEELVERHQRPVYSLIYRMTRNTADAEELAQEVFVRAYRSLRDFRRASGLKTWLFRIAINLSIDHLRRARRAPEFLPPPEADEGMGSLERTGLQVRLDAIIGRLPEKQRATLVLRIFHDLSFREIAEVLGSPIGTVKANYHHAVTQLREFVREPGSPLLETR